MPTYINLEKISIIDCLYQFIEEEVLPGLPIDSATFWQGTADILTELTPINHKLLAKRDNLQNLIDQWHEQNEYHADNLSNYKSFLTDIGYLEPVVEDFTIAPTNVDIEISKMAGPQLVVPIMNARFALNAVNARWGSLYDAFYGSDIIAEDDGEEQGPQYNPVRGSKVIALVKQYLDEFLPLETGNHADVIAYDIVQKQLVIILKNGQQTKLRQQEAFIGFTGEKSQPRSLLFRHHNLHIEICIDRSSAIGRTDGAGISDVIIEAALTTIMDLEDSVAAVDGQDKVLAYRNWLGLNKGTLSEHINKSGRDFTRVMVDNKRFKTLLDEEFSLPGRCLMFIRNVGHLMTNDMVRLADGQAAPEGLIDGIITSLIAMYDLLGKGKYTNSKMGSIYIVKPKMHGSEEVAFTDQLFTKIEALLSLPANTIKMGIMDEERRTSVNLKNCIYAAKDRVVFINTGFLDRTGDEIHTSMKAGIVVKKADMKHASWIQAYENNNVDIGLACGFSGQAQIGKGMWPIPDQMKAMLESKLQHALSGANTAWVPSPTAATLHALHYHQVNVMELQQQLRLRERAALDALLTLPIVAHPHWSAEEINTELKNNIQGILGYVVRWIDQGIGCSKVPDIDNIGLMEDRATLRISSQHIANWLYHQVCSQTQVMELLKQMAEIVDRQNEHDPAYEKMSFHLDKNIAFAAASDLIFKGLGQPNGYTEPLLHTYRATKKVS